VSDVLLHAVAQALAEERRVLVLADSFELVERLAGARVKELVVVTPLADPDAPAGSTEHGAPLRMRADWAERGNSKDLVVDAGGLAPAAEVARILKKAGCYLTANLDAPALAHLPMRQDVVAAGALVVLAGTTQPPTPILPDLAELAEDRLPEAAEFNHTGDAELAAALEAAEARLGTFGEALDGADARLREQAEALQQAHARLAQQALALQAAEAQVTQQATALAAAEAQITQQAAALSAAEALAQRTLELEEALAAAERTVARQQTTAQATEQALKALQAEHAEQSAAYTTVRAELSERRIADRRADAIEARFETARREMVKEIESLRSQVREFGEPAEDNAALVGERDEARRAHDEVAEAVALGLQALGTALPSAPPAHTGDAVRSAWLQAVQHTLQVTGAELDRLRHRRTELEAQLEGLWIALRERDEALAAIEESAAEGPAPALGIPLDETALSHQIKGLEAALAAERAARTAEGEAWRGRVQAAQAALDDRRRLLDALAAARQEAARHRLGVAASEDRQRRLMGERLLRDERIADLEVMLVTHTRMQALLSEALDEAESAREEAEDDRRLMEANLRLIERELAARG